MRLSKRRWKHIYIRNAIVLFNALFIIHYWNVKKSCAHYSLKNVHNLFTALDEDSWVKIGLLVFAFIELLLTRFWRVSKFLIWFWLSKEASNAPVSWKATNKQIITARFFSISTHKNYSHDICTDWKELNWEERCFLWTVTWYK